MSKETHKEVLLSKIHADENQPRKDFNASRLSELISSIKEFGIMNPLVVEEHPSGEYLLVDGERRFRAATEIGLKKVPVITVEPMTSTDRLVKQFHLQEQHEGWSSVEKAVAIGQLSEQMGTSVVQMSKLLAIPMRTIQDYVGFWNMMARKEFQKSEVPISYAKHIHSAGIKAKKIYEKSFEEEFDQSQQKEVEKQLIVQIKKGEVTNQSGITKLVDSFVANPDTIEKFLEGKDSVTKLYLDSDAKVARHARNVRQLGVLVDTHINSALELGGVDIMQEDELLKPVLLRVQANVNRLLELL